MTAKAEDLIDRVAKSDAVVRSQQLGEPDLTYEEKCRILNDLLEEKPAKFLSRFTKYLDYSDLSYFERYRNDFEVDCYLKEARNQLDLQKKKKRVSNRRYEYLKQMKLSNSEYFSDKEMRRRCPYLFEEFVGQHMTNAERETLLGASSSDGKEFSSFSEFLFSRIDEKEIQLRQAYEMQLEDDGFEEEEDDSDSDLEEEEEENTNSSQKVNKVTKLEKERLRTEFVSMMEDRFMEGADGDFDYSAVDENKDFDPMEDLEVDAEEAYFDSEEPHTYCFDTESIPMDGEG